MNDPICPPFALVRLPLASSSASRAITPTLLSLSRPHSSLCVVWSYCRPPPTSQLYLIHPRRLLLLVHPAGVERLPPPPNRHIALPYLTTQHLFPSTSPDYQRPLPSLSWCLTLPPRPPTPSRGLPRPTLPLTFNPPISNHPLPCHHSSNSCTLQIVCWCPLMCPLSPSKPPSAAHSPASPALSPVSSTMSVSPLHSAVSLLQYQPHPQESISCSFLASISPHAV